MGSWIQRTQDPITLRPLWHSLEELVADSEIVSHVQTPRGKERFRNRIKDGESLERLVSVPFALPTKINEINRLPTETRFLVHYDYNHDPSSTASSKIEYVCPSHMGLDWVAVFRDVCERRLCHELEDSIEIVPSPSYLAVPPDAWPLEGLFRTPGMEGASTGFKFGTLHEFTKLIRDSLESDPKTIENIRFDDEGIRFALTSQHMVESNRKRLNLFLQGHKVPWYEFLTSCLGSMHWSSCGNRPSIRRRDGDKNAFFAQIYGGPRPMNMEDIRPKGEPLMSATRGVVMEKSGTEAALFHKPLEIEMTIYSESMVTLLHEPRVYRIETLGDLKAMFERRSINPKSYELLNYSRGTVQFVVLDVFTRSLLEIVSDDVNQSAATFRAGMDRLFGRIEEAGGAVGSQTQG